MKSRASTVFAIAILVFLVAAAGSAQWSRQELLARGVNLEKQWGIGVVYYHHEQPYEIASLALGLPGFDPTLASNIGIDSKATTAHLVFDYWLLPYLNVELEAGNIDGTTDVGLSQVNIGIPLQNITVDYDGIFYGAGITLAGGSEKFFASVTAQFEQTDLDQESSSVSAWVFTPRVGMNFGRHSSVFVGGMYQDPDEEHQGTYTIPGLGAVPYDVTLAAKFKWNYIAGTYLGLGEHWRLNLEAGFGDRDSYQAYLCYRW
jgi:hypothetical protein